MARTICNAFLAFCAIILLAALLALYLAWPTTVRAQEMRVTAERFTEVLASQPNVERAILLTKAETATYLEAAAGITNAPEQAQMIVFKTPTEAAIVPLVNGMACPSYGVIRVPLRAHAAGMEAVNGVPI